MILIWAAPSMSCSRTRRSTSASPSAMLAFDELAARPIKDVRVLEQDGLGGFLRESRVDQPQRGRGKVRRDTLQNGATRQPIVDACEEPLLLHAVARAAPAMDEVLISLAKTNGQVTPLSARRFFPDG